MTRVIRGVVAKKRRKKIIKFSKGFQGSHSKLFTAANQQVMKSMRYSYFDRKKKKNNIKKLWILRINAASRNEGKNYSQTINKLKNHKIQINKKILSEIIIRDIKTYKKLMDLI